MKIAITGSSGHIGACLIRKLIQEGHDVNALVYEDERALEGLNINRIKGNILDKDSLHPLVEGADIVFHLAARISIDSYDRDIIYRTNFNGSRNIIEICKEHHVKRLIHFSSIHALKSIPHDRPMDETNPLVTDERFVYDRSKADAERFIQQSDVGNMDVIILNPTAVVGPYDYKPSYLGQAIMKLYTGKLPVLVHGGYNWVDVRDIAKAALLAMDKGKSGHRYILPGTYYTLKELAVLMEKELHCKPPTMVVPHSVAMIGLPFIKLYASITNTHPLYTRESLEILMECNPVIHNNKAAAELGYTSRPLGDTIRDTIQWYKENGFLKN